MKKSVLVYSPIPENLLSDLQNNYRVTYLPYTAHATDPEFITAIKHADGILGVGIDVKKDILDLTPQLKVISTISVGYDNFEVPELITRKVALTNTPQALTDTTADTIFSLILATARRVIELSDLIKSGNWTKAIGKEHFGIDVHHKTLGIVGMGRIGQAVAKRAYCGFDMKVLYTSNSIKHEAEEKLQAKYCQLDELLQNSDFVCLTLPLNPSTYKIINREKLALMKPSAILINGGRGKTVDEKALIEALQNKTIYAAGLDVFESEPLSHSSPLLKLPNVVALPHVGSATHETRYKMAQCAVKNLIDVLEDTPNANIVNPEVLL